MPDQNAMIRIRIACAVLAVILSSSGAYAEYDSTRDIRAKKAHSEATQWLETIAGSSTGSFGNAQASANFVWIAGEGKSHIRGSIVADNEQLALGFLITHHFWDDVFLVRLASNRSTMAWTLRGKLRQNSLTLKPESRVHPDLAGLDFSVLLKTSRKASAKASENRSWELILTNPPKQLGLPKGAQSFKFISESNATKAAFDGENNSPSIDGTRAAKNLGDDCAKRENDALALFKTAAGKWKANYIYFDSPVNEKGEYESQTNYEWIGKKDETGSLQFTVSRRLTRKSHAQKLSGEPEPLPKAIEMAGFLSYDCAKNKYFLYSAGAKNYGSQFIQTAPVTYSGTLIKPSTLKLKGTSRPSSEGKQTQEELTLFFGEKSQTIKTRDDSIQFGDTQDPWREASFETLSRSE